MARQKEYPVTKPMYNPAHPGAVVKELVVKPLNLTVSQAAAKLDIDRTTLSRLMNGHIAVSVEMALRLSKAIGNGGPEIWLNMQQSYDLWQARKNKSVDLSRVKRFSADAEHAPL